MTVPACCYYEGAQHGRLPSTASETARDGVEAGAAQDAWFVTHVLGLVLITADWLSNN